MKKFCKDLKEHTMKIINYEKEIISLTDEENESYFKQNVCHICKKNIFLILIITVKICLDKFAMISKVIN